MPATATAPVMPTISRHSEGCPAMPDRQELFDARYPSTHRTRPSELTGVARCRDCGVSDLIEFAVVAAYREAQGDS